MSAPTDLVNLGHNRGQARLPMAQSIWRLDDKLGRPLDINRAYADYNSQMRYYLDWTAFKANPTAWRRANPGRSDPPLALHPDKSWHCKGMAIDTDDRLGQRFSDAGFRFTVATEPWHGQYYAYLDKFYGQPSSGGSKPFPNPIPKPPVIPKGTDMYIRNKDTQDIALVGPSAGGGAHVFRSADEYTIWRSLIESNNTLVPEKFQEFVPPSLDQAADGKKMLQVDANGWAVALEVSSP